MNKKEKKPNKFMMFIKKHKVISSIIGLFLLFVISLGGTIGIANATRPKEVAIPNLVGKTVEEAKQILKDSKLNYVEGEPEYNTQFEAGKIISQKPEFVQGKNMKENAEVKVVVSLGTEKTIVPKLVGKTKEEAEVLAKEAKINLEIVEETSETVEAGYIIKQEIDPEAEVNAGDTIIVYLSKGTGRVPVVVTSVLYKEEAVAKKTLEDLKLVVKVEYAEDKERGNGVVLKQSIGSGETVDEGTEITITVNKLAEEKECEVIVNVAALTDYTPETVKTDKNDKIEENEDSEGEESKENQTTTETKAEAEKVTVTIYVDGNKYDTSTTKRDNTKYSQTIKATGTVDVRVEIKDSKGNELATKTKKSIDLNKTTSVTFDK